MLFSPPAFRQDAAVALAERCNLILNGPFSSFRSTRDRKIMIEVDTSFFPA
ncbi:predicted protein [Sclerotinia sclerotiorum 1980 UF-70]|uniref:Uncharacterized protein n=1 Tax=Sclerotinia sclerotiorum (strain ATCC 18683 / 1980 / Ss-1) TaxID=665079 RepID=A7E7T2_SCLS1|nr:predicted protein [Sclerotinia sclerotiorum 1980 UF-70]EDN96434.1 predicted protein [Sclerotinia sclerotiorum 1980 UF-70]